MTHTLRQAVIAVNFFSLFAPSSPVCRALFSGEKVQCSLTGRIASYVTSKILSFAANHKILFSRVN